MRKYTTVDLLRFRVFANDNPDLKAMELIKGYNKKFPELSAKEKIKNLATAIGISVPKLLKT